MAAKVWGKVQHLWRRRGKDNEWAAQLALVGPITNEKLFGATIQESQEQEVSGSLTTLARQMATQQMLRDQQAEKEGPQESLFSKQPSLLDRLVETRALLNDAYETLTKANARKVDVSPAGEWLLDNNHIVKEHITEIKRSMPKTYYRELPKLWTGPYAGYPRVYEMAIQLISGTEGVVDVTIANLFLKEFKRAHLRMGELWAFPIMLRLGLIGNIWRMTKRTLDHLKDIELADKWADELLKDESMANMSILRFMSQHPPFTPTFVTRLFFRTRSYRTSSVSSPIYWLEKYMAQEGVDPEEASRQETVQLALTKEVMGNSINSLRKISKENWLAFFESHSETERILRSDPAGIYDIMNFYTRDAYRHAVEGIALRTGMWEEKIASLAINLARKAARIDELEDEDDDISDEGPESTGESAASKSKGKEKVNAGEDGDSETKTDTPEEEDLGIVDPRQVHVGYWLIGDGRDVLEQSCGYKPKLKERIHKLTKQHPTFIYFGLISSITLVLFAVMLRFDVTSLNFLAFLLFVLFSFMLVNDIAIGMVNQIITRIMPPLLLPQLDFVKRPVANNCRTVVVVPTLFSSVAAVEEALAHIEVHYLANRDPNILFAVLSDFTDAPQEHVKNDEEILKASRRGVRELNAKHNDTAFFIFHRPRLFNPRQGANGVWMGWERKRGKLVQFNQFLLKDDETTRSAFVLIEGNTDLLRNIRYVVTLDADTVLPRDAAKQMIATIAHPLNQAVFDSKLQRVVQGYGIIQPRVTTMLSNQSSYFATINSGLPGVDPYTTAVSDVYQDLFAEGSFTGKGIYDVEAFMKATEGRFEDNSILSHDLIEGSYARAGLSTNVEVFDDYPSHYITYSKRKHRWIRGDWQLLRWGVGFWATFDKEKKERIKISSISRWKIFDNLRRSLIEIVQFAFFPLVWLTFPKEHIALGTLLALGFICFPHILSFLLSVVRIPLDGETSIRAYYYEVLRDGYKSIIQVVVALTFMPHQAAMIADAILRTLYRLSVKRNMLEWVTASQMEKLLQKGMLATWIQMWNSVALSGAITVWGLARMACIFDLLNSNNNLDAHCEPVGLFTFILVLPILVLWNLAPSIAHSLSMTLTQKQKEGLLQTQRKSALRYALLHWRYFDSFVNAETKWLPPDNFQEEPEPTVAMRTSPTNIAMHLMAVMTAHDLGFLTTTNTIEQFERIFQTLDKLPRHKGHFYNWYDLNDLRVLNPPYISTVDSGNLAGAFIALKQAFLSVINDPVYAEHRSFEAITVALNVVLKLLGSETVTDDSVRGEEDALRSVSKTVHKVLLTLQEKSVREHSIEEVRTLLKKAATQLRAPFELARGQEATAVFKEVHYWIKWTIDLIHSLVNDELLAQSYDVRKNNFSQYHTSGKTGAMSLGDLAKDSSKAASAVRKLEQLAERCDHYAMEMEWDFLFHKEHKLFSIGFNIAAGEADKALYDLLASESRISSYIAIAKNDVPVEHWFRLGRSLVANGALISWSGTMFEYLMPLILMEDYPDTLLSRTYQCMVAAQISYTQRVHGGSTHIPWGISESAYNFRNREGHYQYRAFGVPDLALKRGQGKDYVVAPYATFLALPIMPSESMENLALLENIGALGPYGFRDSIDYSRPAAYAEFAIVGNYMAHHIGMSLSMLNNVLSERIWQRRFHSDPLVSSTQLLLHERVPRLVSLVSAAVTDSGFERLQTVKVVEEKPVMREYSSADTNQPRVALLGMVPYTVLISNAGSGYSNWGDMGVTRWQNDGTLDNTGQWLYIKDVTNNRLWSAGYQPVGSNGDYYRATLAVDCVSFTRVDGEIETQTRVAVNSTHAAEVRLLRITNNGKKNHMMEVTSYGEIVLQSRAADRAHPAFGNLFIETELLESGQALVAWRRPRSGNSPNPYMAHVVSFSENLHLDGQVQYETDRSRFTGRGRTTRNPVAMDDDNKLSGTVGDVLDPIFSLRVRFNLQPGETVQVAYTTLVAEERKVVIKRADRYSDIHAAKRVFDICCSQMQEELNELSITAEDVMLYQTLVGHLLYRQNTYGLYTGPKSRLGKEGLWAHGISGDWPILLVLIGTEAGLAAFRQLLQAHRYWRQKGVTIDIVVVNTQPPTYLQDLNDQLLAAVTSSSSAKFIDKPGGVFLRRKDILPAESFSLLQTVARVHIHTELGLLKLDSFDMPDDTYNYPGPFEPTTSTHNDFGLLPARAQLDIRRSSSRLAVPSTSSYLLSTPDEETLKNKAGRTISALITPTLNFSSPDPVNATGYARTVSLMPQRQSDVGPSIGNSLDVSRYNASRSISLGFAGPELPTGERRKRSISAQHINWEQTLEPLTFENGYGGINNEGDYEIRLWEDTIPPAPWSMVVANEQSGFLVTESGGGFTYVESSFFYRLTPWTNDPVSDRPGEVIYLRDDADGDVWSTTAGPIRHPSLYRIRYRPGAAIFEHEHRQIKTTVTMGMAPTEPFKITVLEVQNTGKTPRKITVANYVEWTLGQIREHTQHQAYTFYDTESEAICARNRYDSYFAKYMAFLWSTEPTTAFTCDRREFLGRNGSPARPAGLYRVTLTGNAGPGYDPCAVKQFTLELKPGESKKIVFVLGVAKDIANMKEILERYNAQGQDAWEKQLYKSIDLWKKRLSVIQVNTPAPSFDLMVNRWALYQAWACRIWARSGFYQSSGAFGFRDQLQDVMALVYSRPEIARKHILVSARRQFLEGDVQHWWHPHSGQGIRSRISDDLVWLPFVVEHYVAVTGDKSILNERVPFLEMRQLGEHEEDIYDTPKVSSTKGTIYDHCLRALHRASTSGIHDLPLMGTGDWNDGMNKVGCGGKGESVWLAWFLCATLKRFAVISKQRADEPTTAQLLKQARQYQEAADRAWDGAWYSRAYYDDGKQLGSHTCNECRIDSLSQTWSVISEAAPPQRADQALDSLDEHLVDGDLRLIKLLTPPFNESKHNPGYIKGYVPGVRENGGQYTHAAVWTSIANAMRGRGERAFELFQMINPFTHALDRRGVDVYKTEPYALCGDVYTVRGNQGRGGWSWYTGSASWMYRAGLEGILGFHKIGDFLEFSPCVPSDWDEFEIVYRYSRRTVYRIVVRNPQHVNHGVASVELDGKPLKDKRVPLVDPVLIEQRKKQQEEEEKRRRERKTASKGKDIVDDVAGGEEEDAVDDASSSSSSHALLEEDLEESEEAEQIVEHVVVVTLG